MQMEFLIHFSLCIWNGKCGTFGETLTWRVDISYTWQISLILILLLKYVIIKSVSRKLVRYRHLWHCPSRHLMELSMVHHQEIWHRSKNLLNKWTLNTLLILNKIFKFYYNFNIAKKNSSIYTNSIKIFPHTSPTTATKQN